MLQDILYHETDSLTTRQVMAKCKEGSDESGPPFSQQHAVLYLLRTPNTFSDGTLQIPTVQFLGFGAYGTWHPERDVNEVPLHAFEQTYGHSFIEERGVAICGPMQGQRGSSTRGEVGAGVMGLYAPRSIHQASDSMVHVKNKQDPGQHVPQSTAHQAMGVAERWRPMGTF